ncbi:MCE family protein [Nocardioides sp. HDW12B]|uniref:MCE family protein n=1 Tax=Nocardioides sp. HDW12B TaxID=2714939 RepID=UPI00140C3D91|nr:MCE family protein [Nocardioides sp. HDW12B]QIK67584.1 MCE family protein [Nocardioides sp. HDW12B]
MKLLDKKTTGDSIRLGIFIIVTTLATTLLAITIGNISFGATTDYKAVFSDATGVVKGDDVRIAGVKVGTVSGVEIYDKTQAIVEFDVSDDSRLTESTYATIRYRNLVGQRYIALTEGTGGQGELEENDTIPMERTSPALDLTVLFNGFKPLFSALTPADVNKLSMELIQVFQGEGGTIESLLDSTASVTNTLAARDDLVSDLIANLNTTLETVGDRDQELSDLIIQFRRFIGGLTDDRQAILGSLDSISDLTVQTADLVTGIRPGLSRDITQLRTVAGNIAKNRDELDRALKVLPIKLRKVGRTAIYGSWFNFYLCDFSGSVRLAPGVAPVKIPEYPPDGTEAARCNIG